MVVSSGYTSNLPTLLYADSTADLPTLINHGLTALNDTLQQDKHLSNLNTSIAIIGPSDVSSEGEANVSGSGAAKRGSFRTWENAEVEGLLRAWRRSRGEPEEGPQEAEEAERLRKDQEVQSGSGNATPAVVAVGGEAEGEGAAAGAGAAAAAGSGTTAPGGEDVNME